MFNRGSRKVMFFTSFYYSSSSDLLKVLPPLGSFFGIGCIMMIIVGCVVVIIYR